MAPRIMLVLLVGLAAAAAMFHGSQAVRYSVTNTARTTPGGARFEREIGAAFTMQTLSSATNFIWYIFQQNGPADRKNVDVVELLIDDVYNYPGVTVGNKIHVSARYIGAYQGDLKNEYSGVLYHEMTHVWQWNGNGHTPVGLIEGVADYVRLKAGYIPENWVQPGGGDRWDEGYSVTARFLDYCQGLKGGFVAELNKKMRDGYSDQFFVDLLGKPVDQLFQEYKAAYN